MITLFFLFFLLVYGLSAIFVGKIKSTIERFILNSVSGPSRPVSRLTRVHFCNALYGVTHCVLCRVGFLVGYYQWPLG